MKWWVVGLLSLLAAPEAGAVSLIDGNQLYAQCTESQTSALYYQKVAFCLGYIEGIVDVILAGKASGQFQIAACFPGGLNGQQLKDVIVQYLTQHPENRHNSAGWLVGTALAEAFPCR